jgi:outer membrane protein OmpA-like peptidoglycan-associated protein
MINKIKVLLYGSNGAGKTIFNATLYHAINTYFLDRSFEFSDQQSKTYFLDIVNILEDKGWDESNILENIKSTRDYSGNFNATYNFNGNSYAIDNPDYKGEDIYDESKEIFNIVKSTSSFIIIVDIMSNLNGKFLNSRSIEGFKSLNKYLPQNKNFDLAIVFNKVDLLKDVSNHAQIAEYTKNIEEKLKSIFTNINYDVFYISCKKYWHLFKVDQDNLNNSLLKPSDPLLKEFHKITDPFFWIIDQKIKHFEEEKAIAEKNKKLALLRSLQEEKEKEEKRIQEEKEKEIKRIEKEKSDIAYFKKIIIEDIEKETKKLDEFFKNHTNIVGQLQIDKLTSIHKDLLAIKSVVDSINDIKILDEHHSSVSNHKSNIINLIREYDKELLAYEKSKIVVNEKQGSYAVIYIVGAIIILLFAIFCFRQCQNSSPESATLETLVQQPDSEIKDTPLNTVQKAVTDDKNSKQNNEKATEIKSNDINIPKDADPVGAVFNLMADADHDGIGDSDDKCPDIPGMSSSQGCPDRDGDGVEDAADKCPDVAGQVPNKGCPEVKEGVKKRLAFAARNIQFDTGKQTLKNNSYEILDEVASILNEYPYYTVNIDGYCDRLEAGSNGFGLSKWRANSAAEYLKSKGVSSDRLVITAYGDNKPIADEYTSSGRAQNRRVEFNLLFK